MITKAKYIDKLVAQAIAVYPFVATGSSINVTSAITTALSTQGFNGSALTVANSTADNVAGICTTDPQNIVPIVLHSNREPIYSNTKNVFGRITHSAGVYTLSFYTISGGTETAYTFSGPTSIRFYFLYRAQVGKVKTDLFSGVFFDKNLYAANINFVHGSFAATNVYDALVELYGAPIPAVFTQDVVLDDGYSIKANNGLSIVNLRDGADNYLSLASNSSGGYTTESYIKLNPTDNTVGYTSNVKSVYSSTGILNTANYFSIINTAGKDNFEVYSTLASNYTMTSATRGVVTIASKLVTINSGLTETVVLGVRTADTISQIGVHTGAIYMHSPLYSGKASNQSFADFYYGNAINTIAIANKTLADEAYVVLNTTNGIFGYDLVSNNSKFTVNSTIASIYGYERVINYVNGIATVEMIDNATLTRTSANSDKIVTAISAKNISMNAGIINSVAVGGSSYTVRSSNMAYVSNLAFADSTTGYEIIFSAPTTLANDYSLIWPTLQGAAGEVITNDGFGNLSWTTPTGSASSLAASLAVGNTTGGNSIVITNGDFIYSTNGYSALDFGNGANMAIAWNNGTIQSQTLMSNTQTLSTFDNGAGSTSSVAVKAATVDINVDDGLNAARLLVRSDKAFISYATVSSIQLDAGGITIDNSGYTVFNSGQVAIATTSPNAGTKLDVRGVGVFLSNTIAPTTSVSSAALHAEKRSATATTFGAVGTIQPYGLAANTTGKFTGLLGSALWTRDTAFDLTDSDFSLLGVSGIVTVAASAGTVNGIIGVKGTIQNLVAGVTVTDAYGIRSGFNTGVTHLGTTTNFKAYHVLDHTSVTGAPAVSNRWGLYFEDPCNNYLAGTLSIGSDTATTSTILDLVSTTKAFAVPRMTTTQKNAISSPSQGMIVYDTTLAKLCVYTTAWETITSV